MVIKTQDAKDSITKHERYWINRDGHGDYKYWGGENRGWVTGGPEWFETLGRAQIALNKLKEANKSDVSDLKKAVEALQAENAALRKDMTAAQRDIGILRKSAEEDRSIVTKLAVVVFKHIFGM